MFAALTYTACRTQSWCFLLDYHEPNGDDEHGDDEHGDDEDGDDEHDVGHQSGADEVDDLNIRQELDLQEVICTV